MADFEEYARKHLPKMAFDYYAGGADEQQTLKENVLAFKRYSSKTLIDWDRGKQYVLWSRDRQICSRGGAERNTAVEGPQNILLSRG